jgi:outer membrane protein OmpA-like peptidoglycan-associated protein
MKKSLLLVAFLGFAGLMMAQTGEAVQADDSVKIKGVHPYDLPQNEKGVKPEIAHWSLIPHIGFSAFDGDFVGEMKHRVAIPTVGLNLEYNFTPVWSVGVEYMYDMYTVTGNPDLKDDAGNRLNADTLLNGHMHKAGAYVSLDLINLFFPRAHKKIVSLSPYFGAGGAWYKRSRYYMDDKWFDAEHNVWVNPTHGRYNTANYINADGQVGPEHDTKYSMVGYIQAGANLDFNLNRTLALGLRANYTYFTRDYVDGRGYHKQASSSYASKNNDGIFDITLYMRFKLEAVSKSHPRNMPSFSEFDKMLAKANAQQCCHDTVIYHHDSIIVRETIREEKAKMPARIYNVYFDNDKADLRQDAQATIQEAAMVMDNDTSLFAVVIGYCDNTGSKAHNYELGDRRSKNVNDELLEEYGIPASHIYNAGVGKIAARKTAASFGPNRRVSIHLVDKETFELMKMQLEDKNSDRNTDDSQPVVYDKANTVTVPQIEAAVEEGEVKIGAKTIPLSESSAKEVEDILDTYKKRTHETIIVQKGETLSRLARKYYNNTQCWVYIYMANSDKMITPNYFQEGMELIIPELTKEELSTSVGDCLKLYSITAHRNARK